MADFGALCPADRATAIVDGMAIEASDSFAVDRLRIALMFEKSDAGAFCSGSDCELVLDAAGIDCTVTGVAPASETGDYAVVTLKL